MGYEIALLPDGRGFIRVSPNSKGFISGSLGLASRGSRVGPRRSSFLQRRTDSSATTSIGDADGDGVGDFAVGPWLDDRAGRSAGSARAVSGRTGHDIFEVFGSKKLDMLGVAVSGVGDVNGDGHRDVLVGAQFDDTNGKNAGAARIYSGNSGATLYEFLGTAEGDHFGASVSGIGDIN